ncbi:YybH family protein [Rhodococcus koreensis]
MSAETVLQDMWNRYEGAVNANDAELYGRLFTPEAIRMVPGYPLERGKDVIQKNEEDDYAVNHWNIAPTVLDALQIGDDWIYGVANVKARITSLSTGVVTEKSITAAWLLQRQNQDEWLIARHILNVGSTNVLDANQE